MVIGIRTTTLPPITQMGMVDCWVAMLLIFLFTEVVMVMRELDIGLIPENFLPITVLENNIPHQGPLNMISIGVGEKKCSKTLTKTVALVYINIILIILI